MVDFNAELLKMNAIKLLTEHTTISREEAVKVVEAYGAERVLQVHPDDGPALTAMVKDALGDKSPAPVVEEPQKEMTAAEKKDAEALEHLKSQGHNDEQAAALLEQHGATKILKAKKKDEEAAATAKE